ncbi:MAG: anaerobic C4-dicarboxylate transporter, partial [Bacteroidales bacterium]|nr:anaerobic C4-dicarboxylate transporter [Bacteroidales bacterium]
ERMLRKHPDHITFLGPLTTFFLTVLVGTGHVVYTIMPIICDIALKKGIRPERPCGVSSIASQVGITCSPIAAAVVAFVTISNANGFMVSIPQVLMVTIPACLCGLMCAAAASYKRGKDLDKDPEFLKRKSDPETYQYMYGSHATTLDKTITPEAKASVFIFLGALLVIVLFAFCQMIHVSDGRTVAEAISLPKMNVIIQIIMLTAAACNIMFCKAKPKKAVGGAVWQSGMVAVVAIYGIAWLADTYFGNYLDQMKVMLADIVTQYPWSIAFVFFLVSVLINSQGAVVVAMLPLAYELGIAGPVLLGVLPSVYGYFFIPNYPSDIATVNFDRSGTTVIGKYLLNHSFMMPGLISVIVSTVVGYLIANVLFGGYFAGFVQ